MWRWDQGRIEFLQFDALRKIAKFAVNHDLTAASRAELVAEVDLPFLPNDPSYKPWRNYGRMFRLAMLVYKDGGVAKPTPLAVLLAKDGQVTTDDYFHFLAEAFTDPSPAFDGWDHTKKPRYPLLFCLRLMLCRAAIGAPQTGIRTLVNAYAKSGYTGDEDQTAFLAIADWELEEPVDRQARESILALAQISYLEATDATVKVSLKAEGAMSVFEDLAPVGGERCANREQEILRVAGLFEGSISQLEFGYEQSVETDLIQSGFREGTRVEKTHLAIERNSSLRAAFFASNPSSLCDMCQRDTQKEYPWTERVLEVHHVMPLSSGTRTGKAGTTLDDLVANCPTCHRAVHSYYAKWLKDAGRKDFIDAAEAKKVYEAAKNDRKDP